MRDEMLGAVIELRPDKKMAIPHGEVNGVRWSKARDVLLIDGVVVGQLKQIPWLAGYGWHLSSAARGPIETPSLPGLVRAWLGRRLCEGVRP